jgi:hypothetical protein
VPRFRTTKYRNVEVKAFKAQFRGVVGKPIRQAALEKRRAMALVINWHKGAVAAWPILYGEGCDIEAAELKDELLQDVAERFELGAEVDAWILMSGEAIAEMEKREAN